MAHGKASRDKNRKERLAKKRARRESNQLQWQSFAAQGKNKKTKRKSKSSSKRWKRTISADKHQHRTACGNHGCKQCHPEMRRGTV